MLNTKQMQLLSKMNLISLCKEAGLKSGTIRSKLNRGTELKVNESEALTKALEKFGITINQKEV